MAAVSAASAASAAAAVAATSAAAVMDGPRMAHDVHASVTIDQPLDSVVGFYASETDALESRRWLSTMLGLTDSQLLLLRPNDGGSLRFALRSRQWATRLRQEEPGIGNDELLVLLGVTLAGLGGAMLLALDNALMIFVLALLCVAATGAAWAWRSHQPQHLTQFAGIVRSQLVAGHWGLLVHGVLDERQPALVESIRSRSVNWCAVSVARHTL